MSNSHDPECDDEASSAAPGGEARSGLRLLPAALPPKAAQRAPVVGDEEVPGEGSADASGAQRSGHGSYGASLIDDKHREYTTKSHFYKTMYYCTRLVGGGATLAIPFVVTSLPKVAIGCSALACAATLIEAVFDPMKRWRTFAKATHLLALGKVRRERGFAAYKEGMNVLIATEEGELEQLTDLTQVLQKFENKR